MGVRYRTMFKPDVTFKDGQTAEVGQISFVVVI